MEQQKKKEGSAFYQMDRKGEKIKLLLKWDFDTQLRKMVIYFDKLLICGTIIINGSTRLQIFKNPEFM